MPFWMGTLTDLPTWRWWMPWGWEQSLDRAAGGHTLLGCVLQARLPTLSGRNTEPAGILPPPPGWGLLATLWPLNILTIYITPMGALGPAFSIGVVRVTCLACLTAAFCLFARTVRSYFSPRGACHATNLVAAVCPSRLPWLPLLPRQA